MTHPSFMVNKNGTNQDSIAGNTPTLITWPNEAYDVGTYFSSNGWTPPAGKVWISGRVYMTGTITVGSTGFISIYKNGSAYFLRNFRAAGTNLAEMFISAMDIANGTDVYTIYISQVNSSGTLTVDGHTDFTGFCGHWIADEVALAITQKHFRFRIDMDAVDATPTWGAAEDVGQ